MRALGLAVAAALLAGLASDSFARSAAEVRAFRAGHPCPATGRTRGACPGWQVDHLIALVCGGPDHRSNMQWLTVEEHRKKTRYDVRYCKKKSGTPRARPTVN